MSIDACSRRCRDAGFLGYDCILIDDCAATTSPDYVERAAKYLIRGMYGFIARSGDVIRALDDG